jgi:acyl-CoA thioester hydrolase
MKPSPERLALAAYPVQMALETRFADLDVLHHVNNVAMASLFQETRVRSYHEIRARVPEWTGGLVVVSLSIAYLREALYPAAMTGGFAISETGRTSFKVAQALFQDGACVSTADVVQVYRGDGGAPAPLPEKLRDHLRTLALRE